MHEQARRLSPGAWLDFVLAGGSFPSADVQSRFVGSSGPMAMREALTFYRFVHSLPPLVALRYRMTRGQYLDFGCGWGRFSRMFVRDFPDNEITGVDIDPEVIATCSGLPGQYLTIGPPPLPFRSGTFRLVTAYSVFTHLPPSLFEAWLAELGRVLISGGLLAFTVEPPRFLEFVAGIRDPQTGWHRGLAGHQPRLAQHRTELESFGITFLPTGGGGVRTSDIYGDTVVTRSFVDRLAATFGRTVAYVDDPHRFWQAAMIVQKR